MARNPKLTPGIQVFRGSRPRQDVFAANSGSGCCPTTAPGYDKLGDRTRFDNSLAHSNPTGANDKFVVPFGNGFSGNSDEIVDFINAAGVGGMISVLAIPTFAFVTGVGIHIEAEEPGLTFDLVTRNGLELPTERVLTVSTDAEDACTMTRTIEADLGDGGDGGGGDGEGDGEGDGGGGGGAANAYLGFGQLNDFMTLDIFGRNAQGEFSLEADEIALRVASMPANGIVTGAFKITVSVSYDVIHRAEF